MQLTFGTINLKDISIIVGMVLAPTGFYYSTTYRLGCLETAEATVQADLAEKQEEVSEINERLIRIEENVSAMKRTLVRIETALISE